MFREIASDSYKSFRRLIFRLAGIRIFLTRCLRVLAKKPAPPEETHRGYEVFGRIGNPVSDIIASPSNPLTQCHLITHHRAGAAPPDAEANAGDAGGAAQTAVPDRNALRNLSKKPFGNKSSHSFPVVPKVPQNRQRPTDPTLSQQQHPQPPLPQRPGHARSRRRFENRKTSR